jgi:hypothetical protein
MVSSTIRFVTPEWSLRQHDVIEARRRRCQFGTDCFDLEGDALGRPWPCSAKGAT